MVDLVDGHRNRLAEPLQELRKFAVDAREFGAAVDHKDDLVGLFEGGAGLAKDLARDQSLIMRHDAAGVDQGKWSFVEEDFAFNPVPGDARFVAHNGASLAD